MNKEIKVKPVFVKTKNVRNLEVMMDGLAMAAGEGRLGLVFGRAGRGKTRSCQTWYGHNGGVFMRAMTIWRTSELEFLKELCRQLGIKVPPKRKGPAFIEALERLSSDPRPVFIDEIEKLPGTFLDVIRDLSDLSLAPFILVGEEELVYAMKRNRRVWSRTYQQLEFEPISISDVIGYAKAASGLAITPGVASILHRSSEGDFRIVRRDMLALVQIANAKNTEAITEDMAKIAVKTGLSA